MAPSNHPDLPWPLASGAPGIEVWYGLAGPRDGSLAFWFRYTLLSTGGGLQEARLWAALTHRSDPGRGFLFTRRFDLAEAHLGTGDFAVDVGDAGHLDDGHAKGRLEAPFGPVAWDLAWTPDPEPFTPIGSALVTEVAVRLLGAGRHRSVNEAVRAEGHLELAGLAVDLDDAPAHQGHTSGRVLNDAWCWIQCNAFEDETVAFEALHLKGMTTVCLKADGKVHRLNRLRDLFGPSKSTSRSEVGRWRIEAKGDGVRLEATVTVDDPALWQRASYLSPDGTLRYNAHSSLANVELVLRTVEAGGWSAPRRLASRAGRAEWVAKKPGVAGSHLPDVWEAPASGARHLEAAP